MFLKQHIMCVFRISIVRHIRNFAKSLRVTPLLSNMKIGNHRLINADIQARIEPPPIPPIKAMNRKAEETNIIKIKMRRDPASTTSETCELNFQTFKNVKP